MKIARTLLVFWNEIQYVARDKKNFSLRILLPLFMIVILGTALSGDFNNGSVIFKDMNVLYLDSSQTPLSTTLQHCIKTGTAVGIRFQEAKSLRQGIDQIKKGRYACFIYDTAGGPVIYKNNRLTMEAAIIETFLTTFIHRDSALTAIAGSNPAAAIELSQNETGSVPIQETTLNRKRKPQAIDYYAVTMLTMTILYSSYTGVYAIKREKLGHTANRLLCTPLRIHEIITGKIMGCLCAILFQVLAVFTVSIYVFKVYWGSDPALVMILLLSEIIMATSIGMGLAFLIPNHLTINGLLNLGIPVLTFLGGGYISIDQFSRPLLALADISPLRWTNRAIFEVIYDHELRSVIPAVGVNLAITIIFMGVASRFARKEAFLK